MKTKNTNLLKKIVSVVVSLFLFNSITLNNFAYAAPIQLIPIAQNNNILQTKIDPSIAYVTDSFKSSPDKSTIFFIQDLHTNPSVQKNISKILEQLDKQYGIDRIFLEGLPIGKADMSLLNTLKEYNVSEELLNKNIISGAEYYFFNNNTNAQIYGIEDWEKYFSNIKRAAKIIQDQDYIVQTFNAFKEDLYATISNIKKIEKYINFNLSDDKILSKTNQPILKYKELHKYISLSDNINNLNIKKIQEEQNLFISDLKTNLPASDYKDIISLSKKDNLKEYYSVLYENLTKNNIYKTKYQNLNKLLEYTLQESQLNILNIISQKNKYFNDYLSSISNDKFQQDMFVVKMTQVFQNFITISISDEDYNFFVENYQKYINLLPQYLSQKYERYSDFLFFDTDIIFDYHKTNKDRNLDFIKNISTYLKTKQNNNKVTIIIAGGFHTSILEQIKEKHFSYVLLTPNIENNYNSDFYNELILSSISNNIETNALAPVRQLLMQGKSFYHKDEDNTLIKFYNTVFTELLSILTKNHDISLDDFKDIITKNKEINGIPITIDNSDPELFVIKIYGNKITYRVENNKIILQSVSTRYKKKKFEEIKAKIVAETKGRFNVFEATSLQLNPDSCFSSKFFSIRERTKRNFMFTLSMILTYFHKNDWAYELMMGFASINKNKTTMTIDFDTDFSDKIKKLKNFSNFKGKKLNITIENDLNKYLSKEDILNIVAAAIARLDTPSIDFKEGLFIGCLDKSTNLFEDHLNNGFIGVNSGIFQIQDEDVKKAIIHSGIIHELTHEFKGSLNSSDYNIFEERMMFSDMKFLIEYMAKIEYGQDVDFGSLLYSDEESNMGRYEHIINRITSALTAEITEPNTGKKVPLFTGNVRFIRKFQNYKYNIEDISKFIKRKNFSVIGRRGQLQHIENEYLQGNREAQEKLFSNLIVTEKKEDSMEDFLRKHIREDRIAEVDKSIKELIQNFEDTISSSDLDPKIKEKKIKEFERHIYEVLHLMYSKMPDYLFGVYYNEQGVIADHALNHSIELLNNAILILQNKIDKIEKLDIRALVFSAFLHDVSCTLLRLDHEQNSATFARAILEGELLEEEIDKIYKICIGHKKLNFEFDPDGKIIITDIKTTEEQRNLYADIYTEFLEARILRDADGLSAALALDRILGVWLTTKQTFINRDLSIDDRKKLIEENKFLMNDGGDAINDLLRQFLRRDRQYYITEEAGNIIESQKRTKLLYDFLNSQETRNKIKNAGMEITDKDIDEGLAIMKQVLNELLPEINEGAEEITEKEDIQFLDIKQRFKLFKLVHSYFSNRNIHFNQNMAVSDIHGGYSRFAELIINLLDPTLDISEKTDKEIDDIIIDRLRNMNSNMLFYLLGDLLDRGNRQVETFELVRRISETGRLRYVMGNHDLYAFMNLLGLHLPFYEGYKGIPDDYIDFQGRDIKKLLGILHSGDKEFLRSFMAEKGKHLSIDNILDKKFWAKKLFEYMDYAEQEQPKWKTKEKELQDLFKETFHFNLDDKGKDVLNDVSIALNSEITSSEIKAMFLDPEFLNFHKKFFGRNVGIVVYTGIRAVNKMSINWWRERAREVELLKEKYNKNPDIVKYWDTLLETIKGTDENDTDSIINQQKSMYEKEVIDEGNIAWAIIDAIMYRNYESTEWNALDWAYHNNWGGGDNGFIAQRSKKLSDAGQPTIDKVSYFDDSVVNKMIEFYRKNFYLYRFDEYGICYMHSMLPVDEYGDISIGYVDDKGIFHERDKHGKRIKGFFYKGVHYKGKNIFKGLNKISEDIRNYDISSNKLSDIMEALTLLTAIYADNTTRVKPANLREMKAKFGFHEILKRKGITTLVVGHNPVDKIGLDNQFEYTTLRFFNKEFKIVNLVQIDGNMSPGYKPPKGAGLVRFIGGEINTRGFLRGDSTEITSSVHPDVTKEIFINSILFNAFPILKDILFLTEKIYDKFSLLQRKLSFGNIKINKHNTTIIDIIQSDDDIENIAEKEHIMGIKNIVIAPSKMIEGLFFIDDDTKTITGYLDDIKDVKYEIKVQKIKVAKGYIPIITYSYEYTNNAFDDQAIQNKIIEQIIERINKNIIDIKTTKNMFINNSVNDTFESVSLSKSITKIFGPILYDVRTKKGVDIERISENVNIDKIKDILAAA